MTNDLLWMILITIACTAGGMLMLFIMIRGPIGPDDFWKLDDRTDKPSNPVSDDKE